MMDHHLTAAGAVLTGALASLILTASGSALTTPTGAFQATLELPSGLHGEGTLRVSVERPEGYDRYGQPTKIIDVPIAVIDLHSGRRQQVVALGRQAISTESVRVGGLVQVDFVATFENKITSSTVSLPVDNPLTNGRGRSPAGQPGATTSVRVRFGTPLRLRAAALRQAAVRPNVGCIESQDGRWEKAVRLGQMQDSSETGSKVKWTYTTHADSVFTVGESSFPASSYSASGTYTVSNAIGTTGGFPEGPGFNRYVDGDMYLVRYFGTPSYACGWSYRTYFDHSAGDSFPGTYQPPRNPWHRCGADPNGWSKMNPKGGFFNQDHGKAVTYSGVASFFGFTVGGHTGYSSYIHIDYTNNSPLFEYVCGTAEMPDSPVLWSNASNGT